MTAVFVCSQPSDASAIAARGFTTVGAMNWTRAELHGLRGRDVRVLRHDATAARGCAAVLSALSCDVRLLDRDVDVKTADLLAEPAQPMFQAPPDAPDQAVGDDHGVDHMEVPYDDSGATAGLLYEFADDLGDGDGEADELVERLLTRGAMSVLYGDSNSGKTFAAIDIGAAVCRGIPWMNRNTERGMVVYLASESPASVRLRLRAYQKHYGIKVPNFVIVRSPIDLFAVDGDTEAVILLVRRLEQEHGIKVELIVGDTLSRLSAGANENSGEDMSVVVRHVDRIRQKCNAHFLLIHHSGKNAAMGARGWSGLRAATDTEIEITNDPDVGLHAAEITKQRDIPGKGDRIGFRLQVVELGIGKWQRPITSCVVLSADAPMKQTAKRPSEIGGAIVEFLTARDTGIKKSELVHHFDGRYTSSAVYRELKRMAEAGTVHEVVGIIALRRPC